MKDEWKVNLMIAKSTTYILPILNIFVKFEFVQLIKSSYLFNNEKDLSFSVLYKYIETESFMKYEKKLLKHALCIGKENYGDYVLYKFLVPDKMEEAINLYIQGKYSEFSKEHKNAILDFHIQRKSRRVRILKGILNKEVRIRKLLEEKLEQKIPENAELSSIPDLSTEIFSEYLTKK